MGFRIDVKYKLVGNLLTFISCVRNVRRYVLFNRDMIKNYVLTHFKQLSSFLSFYVTFYRYTIKEIYYKSIKTEMLVLVSMPRHAHRVISYGWSLAFIFTT